MEIGALLRRTRDVVIQSTNIHICSSAATSAMARTKVTIARVTLRRRAARGSSVAIACRSAILAGTLGACTVVEPTQLLVFVDTDLPAAELGAFGVRVIGPDGEDDRGDFAAAELPASFGVAPKDGDPERAVEILVDANGTAEAPLFTTRARTSFVDDEILRLDMFLAQRCRYEALDCAPDETCTLRGCEPADIDPEELPDADDPPPPPPPLVPVDWTWWADGAESGGAVAGDDGAGFLAIGTPPGAAFQLGEEATQLEPSVGGYVARVELDGRLGWMMTMRAKGAPAAIGITALATDGERLWIVVAATDGLVIERDGATVVDVGGSRQVVLRIAVDGSDVDEASFDEGAGVDVRDIAIGPDRELVLGGTPIVPGGLLDATWSGDGTTGLVIVLDGELQGASACPLGETGGLVYGVAPALGGIAAIISGALGPFVDLMDSTCGPLGHHDFGELFFGFDLTTAAGGDLGVITPDFVATLSLETGEVTRQAGFGFVGDGTLHITSDARGRMVLSGYYSATFVYDQLGLTTDRQTGLLLGTGADLAGRWIHDLETTGLPTTVVSAVPDDATGAVIFAAQGAGAFDLDDVRLDDRGGPSIMVHRFMP